MQNKKFDSMAIRSFIRTMYEKGFIPEETVVKTASESIEISDNFNANVLKLAEKLRSLDLKSYAEDLEKNYLNFKLAEADLYKMFNETGEDLIEAAHGKNVRVDVPGDNLVENIIEQQLKGIAIVRKNPTGKLSSIQAIQSIKNSFGQSTNQLDILTVKQNEAFSIWKQLEAQVSKSISAWSIGMFFGKSDFLTWSKVADNINNLFKTKPQDLTLDKIEDLNSRIRGAYSFVNNLNNEELVARANPLFNKLFTFYGPMKKARDALIAEQSPKTDKPQVEKVPANKPVQEVRQPQTISRNDGTDYKDPMLLELQDKYKKLTGVWKQIITNGTDVYTAEERGAALAWINDESKLIGNFLRSNPTAEYIGSRQRAAMKEMIEDCNSFYGDYIA